MNALVENKVIRKYLLLSFLVLFGTFVVSAQEWDLLVDGKIYKSGKKLEGAVITLYKNGTQVKQMITQSNGKFNFELVPDAIYLITLTKPGFITKRFTVNTRNVPSDRAKFANFNPFEPDVNLWEMPKDPGVDRKSVV